MILRAYKVQLDVNNKQQTLLLQHIGCARWAYNWALAKKKEFFDKKEKVKDSFRFVKFDWGTNWYKCNICDEGFAANNPSSYIEQCKTT
jgi:transposase